MPDHLSSKSTVDLYITTSARPYLVGFSNLTLVKSMPEMSVKRGPSEIFGRTAAPKSTPLLQLATIDRSYCFAEFACCIMVKEGRWCSQRAF